MNRLLKAVVMLLCLLCLAMFAAPDAQACDRFQQVIAPQFVGGYAQQVIVPQRVIVQPIVGVHQQAVIVPQAIRQRIVVRQPRLIQRVVTPRQVQRIVIR